MVPFWGRNGPMFFLLGGGNCLELVLQWKPKGLLELLQGHCQIAAASYVFVEPPRAGAQQIEWGCGVA